MNRNKWLILALIVSIGVNLLIAGVVIGRYLDGGPPGRMHFEWLMQELGDETRSRIRKNMHQQMKSSHEERRALRQAQRKLHETIISEPFDENKVRSAMLEVRSASATLQEKMHDHMAKNLSTLSAEERLKVFKVLSQVEQRRHRPPVATEQQEGR